MTTTDQFQTLPDFFMSEGECKLSKETKSSNPRYEKFKQTHFTAGDIDQFYLYKHQVNGSEPNPDIIIENNIWKDQNVGEHLTEQVFSGYKNINTESVNNTFRYIFEKFKKGVFVKIKDNKLDVFLPFSKINYTNEWGSRMNVDPKYKMSIIDFLLYTSKKQDPKFSYLTKENVNRYQNTWYANNCLIRTEFPIGENDRGLSNYKDMLTNLCETRKVPDIEFFINKRDFPILKIDGTEPYEHIFDSEKYDLISHKYDKYCPILSSVTTDRNADIPFPTAEDWARVSNIEDGKWFSANCRSYSHPFETEWDLKKPIAVFRGSSTGCGVTVDTNPRLKIAFLAKTPQGKKYLDAGITSWNLRPRKLMGNPYLQTIEKEQLPFWEEKTDGLVNGMSPLDQSKYKYIVNIDGHVSAFRLSLEMSMGSVVLLVESKYRMWFHKFLVPYEHFVPVKGDLSDLFSQIEWCVQNDDKCRQIAKNAKQFYDAFLTKKGVLDYMQKLLIIMKKTTGTYFYNTHSVHDVIFKKQLTSIKKTQDIFYDPLYDPERELDDSVYLQYPFKNRNIYAMDGFQSFLREQKGLKRLKDDLPFIHSSKDTSIQLVYVDQLPLSVKKTSRKNELVNEMFVGLRLNKLLYHIPNFKYTFHMDTKSVNHLISEHIQGITLKEYIQNGCKLSDMINILIMLTMTLCVAQEKAGFVHYDLNAWNIVISHLQSKRNYQYQFGQYLFEIETDVVPIIIDYGKSHIIHNEMHYGTIEPFKMSKIQDCFCMVVSCLSEYLHSVKTVKNDSVNKTMFYLSNFFSGSEFQKKKISTSYELSEFLHTHKKYNEMIYRDKCDLEQKDPVQFLFYLLEGLEGVFTLKIQQYNYPEKSPDPPMIQSSLFYYNLITKRDPTSDIVKYIDEAMEMFKEMSDKVDSALLFIDLCNTTQLSMKGVKLFTDQYVNDNTEIHKKREDLEHSIKKVFDEKIMTKNQTIKLSIPVNEYFSLAKYNPTTFSIPEKILTLIQSYRNSPLKNTDIIEWRDMFIFNFFYKHSYTLPNERDVVKKYGKIFNVSPLTLTNYNATVNTLLYLSKKIYKADLDYVSKLPNPPQKTVTLMKSILSF
jgi:hypothetical protein